MRNLRTRIEQKLQVFWCASVEQRLPSTMSILHATHKRIGCSLRCSGRSFAILVVLLSLSFDFSSAWSAERPNILFLFADDWGRHASILAQVDAVSGMNDVVKTPNIDSIATQGVLFRNAFVNAPSCTPCRSSLLTGQYFWRCGRGSILQGAVWEDTLPCWPLLLKDSGYFIGKAWKVWRPGKPSDAPFGKQKYAFEDAGGRFNQFSMAASELVNSDKSVDQAKQILFDEVRANFQSFLAANKNDQPFCYWFGPTNVHRKWQQGSGVALWGIDPDQLKGKLPPYLPDVPEVREDLTDYLGEVQAFDTAVGILVEELKRAGKYENTFIVASGDHGPPGFPHGKCNLYDFGTRVNLVISGPAVPGGRVVDDFVSLPDLAPTFLEVASVEIPAETTARSLLPVLHSQQSGLVDASRDAVFVGRERHVADARADFLPYPQRAIRTADYLFITNFRPQRYPLGDPRRLDDGKTPSEDNLKNNTFITLADEDAGPTKAWIVAHRSDPAWQQYFTRAYGKRPREELYDLKRDPHQMKNVADLPKYSSVVDKLRQRLLNVLKESGDPRLIGDGKYYENPPLAGPVPVEEPKQPKKSQSHETE